MMCVDVGNINDNEPSYIIKKNNKKKQKTTKTLNCVPETPRSGKPVVLKLLTRKHSPKLLIIYI